MHNTGIPSPDAPQASWCKYSDGKRSGFLLVLFLVAVSNNIDRNIISILLEPIKTEFAVSDSLLGLLSGFAFAVFYASLGIPIARLADRGDRRLVISVSLAIWSAMTVLCGTAHSFWQLALARVGVGAGEAGGIPPAQSLLADYYPPDRRGRAFAIFTMASTFGYVLGLIVGGWVAFQYGWRMAFLLVGLPGLPLALIVYLSLDEPRRSIAGSGHLPRDEKLANTFRALWKKRSYRNIVVAAIFYWMLAYGALIFTPSFLIRTHGLNVAEAGSVAGFTKAASAFAGTILAAAFADRLAQYDPSRIARISGWGLIGVAPLLAMAYAAPSFPIMVACYFCGGVLLSAVLPAMFQALHFVCGSQRRAMAVAILFFFANLIGHGVGPLTAGSLSDAFARTHGTAQGLRLAIIAMMLLFLPAGWFMLRAARTLNAETED